MEWEELIETSDRLVKGYLERETNPEDKDFLLKYSSNAGNLITTIAYYKKVQIPGPELLAGLTVVVSKSGLLDKKEHKFRHLEYKFSIDEEIDKENELRESFDDVATYFESMLKRKEAANHKGFFRSHEAPASDSYRQNLWVLYERVGKDIEVALV